MLRCLPVCLALLFVAAGCTITPPPDNGGDGGDETVVNVDLGTTGMFSTIGAAGENASGVFDVSASVPADPPESVEVFFDPADIALGTGTDITSTGLAVLVTLTAPDSPDPCGEAMTSYTFEVSLGTNGASGITPAAAALDTDGFALATSGKFGVCITVVATQSAPVTFTRFRLRFKPPADVVATSCADILALPEVQNAIAQVESNGFDFTFPSTNGVLGDLTGEYALSQVVTFDPDGHNEGDRQAGSITLDNQTPLTIRRTGFGASTTFFTAGNVTSVGFCALQRTNDPRCDQTIARIEALSREVVSGDMQGQFLSVAVRRHRFTQITCGARGDYVFGDITLKANSTSNGFIGTRGKVALPDNFVPLFLAVAPNGNNGAVTDRDSDTAVHFSTASPFAAEAIDLPAGLGAEGFSALGISRDSSKLAIVTDLPDAGIIYDNSTLQVVRANAKTSADYLGGVVDFSADDSRIFVPTTDPQFADRVTVLRADAAAQPDIIREFVTPQGEVPVQVRLSPDGTRLALLLEGDAPAGEANLLTFGNPTTGDFTLPPIDLTDKAGGTALASEIVFSPSGNRIFLAGVGAVLAVQTSSPFTIDRIDVSDGAGDNPVSLALSNDGEVLAVAIDDQNGPADFAVIDAGTLEVLNAQNVPGVATGRALGVAHFGTARIAVLASVQSTVVAVQTESPYLAASPIVLAPDADHETLGKITAGGGIIAVTNIDEPAVYLLEVRSGQ